MISSTSRHAIRALIILAQLPKHRYAQAAAVAKLIRAPGNYLGKTLQALCRQGLLLSHKGRGGGFRLARDPHCISLYDVVEPIEGLSRKPGCILGKLFCSDASPCPAHKAFAALAAHQERFLKKTTIGMLADRYRGTRGKGA
ncbi:MAG: Rrf2 family transcriptional regulator [Planctomycetota bacterium]